MSKAREIIERILYEGKSAQAALVSKDAKFAKALMADKEVWSEFESVNKYIMDDGTVIFHVSTPSHGYLYTADGLEVGEEDGGIVHKKFSQYDKEWKALASKSKFKSII